MKLIYQLTSGFMIIASLIFLVGYFSINYSRDALQKSIETSSLIIAKETMDKINRNIYSRIEGMQAYSVDTVLQELVIQSDKRFDAMDDPFAYIMEKSNEWRAVPKRVITPFMQELIDNHLFEELKEKGMFYEEKYGYRIYDKISVTNKYGAIVGQTDKIKDYKQADHEWWRKARNKGMYIGAASIDESAGIYPLDMAVRINDDKGNFLGVIKAVLNIDEAINIIKEIESRGTAHREDRSSTDYDSLYYKNMEVELLSKEGKRIYSSAGGERFADVSGELYFNKIKTEAGSGSFIMAGDKPGETDKLFTHYQSEGYKDFNGMGWVFIIKHETRKIFTPIHELKNYILFVSTIITSLGIIIGIIISASIAKPVKKLTKVAKAVGRGDLDQRVDISSTYEIGQLGTVFNDMIERRKQSEEQLTDRHDQLAELVNERTGELQNAYENLKLEITERKVAETELVRAGQLASIGQLAAGVAHEINNPTNGIINYSQILVDKLDADSREHNISRRIMKEGKRIASIVKSLLSFSRMREDDHNFLYINDIVNVLLNLTEKLLNNDHIRLSLNGLSNTSMIWCNQQQIQQVFLNIISNARYALNSKSTVIKDKELIISALTIDKDKKPHMRITFRDSGCGIEKEDIDKVFNPFFSSKPKEEGNGLGLAISQNIVNQHKGTIAVESVAGKFTEFTIDLPLERQK